MKLVKEVGTDRNCGRVTIKRLFSQNKKGYTGIIKKCIKYFNTVIEANIKYQLYFNKCEGKLRRDLQSD